ncbi:hypothetical protein [Epilithonimonas sp. UC225_85]
MLQKRYISAFSKFKSTKIPIAGKADEHVKMAQRNASPAQRNESVT